MAAGTQCDHQDRTDHFHACGVEFLGPGAPSVVCMHSYRLSIVSYMAVHEDCIDTVQRLFPSTTIIAPAVLVIKALSDIIKKRSGKNACDKDGVASYTH